MSAEVSHIFTASSQRRKKVREKPWALMIVGIIVVAVLVIVVYMFSKPATTMYAATLHVDTEGVDSAIDGAIAIIGKTFSDSVSLDKNGNATFKNLPEELKGDSVRLQLLGELGLRYELLKDESKVVLKPGSNVSVNVYKKKTFEPVDSAEAPVPETKPVRRDITVKEDRSVESYSVIAISYKDLRSTNAFTVFLAGNTCSFEGKLCSYKVYGEATITRKGFMVTSGNLTGSFILSADSSRLEGAFIITESDLSCAANLEKD